MMCTCPYCGVVLETEAVEMKHEQICGFITRSEKIYKKHSREMEAKKVDSRVCNIKVYVNGKSAELQKKLFESGCKWYDGTRYIRNTDPPFLYVNQEGVILDGHWMDVFVFDSSREENVDKILTMIPVSERDEACQFKAYDRVLGRNGNSEEWNIDLFIRMRDEPYKYECFRNYYEYCIPYAGNEHLVGLTKKK